MSKPERVDFAGGLPPAVLDERSEAVLDERQCAELIGWPLAVFRAAVQHDMYPPHDLVYRGKPLWLARLQHININTEE